jgi:hypothetical protein
MSALIFMLKFMLVVFRQSTFSFLIFQNMYFIFKYIFTNHIPSLPVLKYKILDENTMLQFSSCVNLGIEIKLVKKESTSKLFFILVENKFISPVPLTFALIPFATRINCSFLFSSRFVNRF